MRHLDEGALQAWLDRDRSGLVALERDEIGLHLAGCEACRRRLDEVAEVSSRAGVLLGDAELADDTVPPYAEVLARARLHDTAGRGRSPWIVGGWAASVALALGLGWMANGMMRGAPAARAPTATVVQGRVTDADGRPLEAAQVYAEGTGRGTLTDAEGRFRFELPGAERGSAADVTVVATIMGYATERRSVARGGDDVTADFRLPQAAVALDQIVVTGTPSRPVASASRDAVPGVTVAPSEIVLAPGGDEASWVPADRTDAERRAGFGLLTVPELRILRIQVEESADVALVRVVQELPGGAVLDLVEALGTLRFDPSASEDGRARAVIRRGAVSVAAAAPIDPEALRVLLDRLR